MTTPSRIATKILFSALFLLLLCNIGLTTASTNHQSGSEWLDEKRQQANVEALPSGLLYQRKTRGEGEFHPAFDTYCQIELEVSRAGDAGLELLESTVTDDAAPKLVRPIDSLPAVREALEFMVEGDWWELYAGPSHSNNNKDDYLLISLELVSIQKGDLIPMGEHHPCYVELVWDESRGQYHYLPMSECDEQDVGYIQKVADWDSRSSKPDKEQTRLRSLLARGNMKDDLARWARRRIHILKQFLSEEMRMCAIYHPEGESTFFQEDCNAQEQDYISKVQYWDWQKIQEEVKRLEGLDQSSLDPLLGSWIRKRIRILNQVGSFKQAGVQLGEEIPIENTIQSDEPPDNPAQKDEL